MVGVDQYSDFPPELNEAKEAGDVAVIGGYWNPSIEAILSLEPDLVVGVSSVPSHIQARKVLAAYGIPVILLPYSSLEDIRESLIMAGKATGEVVSAYKAAVEFDMAVAAAGILLEGLEPVETAVIVWPNPLFVVGGGTWEHEIIEAAGGVNVYGDTQGWPQVSYESLLEKDPDVIILMGDHGEGGVTVEGFMEALESQLGDAAWEIDAVASGRIYILLDEYNDSFARPSPRTVLSMFVMAAVIHPEAFDMQPDSLPSEVSPGTLDILALLEGRLPGEVLEFLGGALG